MMKMSLSSRSGRSLASSIFCRTVSTLGLGDKKIDTRLLGWLFLVRSKLPFESGKKTKIVADSNSPRLGPKPSDSAKTAGTDLDIGEEAGMDSKANDGLSDPFEDVVAEGLEGLGKAPWTFCSCNVACLTVQKLVSLPRVRQI
jgi:hypothetical protein